MRRAFGFAVAILLSSLAHAAYNANMQGALVGVWAYSDIDAIYFYLTNQPTSHPVCSTTYFVIDETVPSDRRQAMYARLLVAYTMGEVVNIGYDSTANCAHGYIRVHRVG